MNYDPIIDAALELADQAEKSLVTCHDHATRESTFAIVAAFRAFADLIVIESESENV